MPPRYTGQTAAIRSALAKLLWDARRVGYYTMPDRIAVALCRAGVRVILPDCPVTEWVKRETGLRVLVSGPTRDTKGNQFPGSVFVPDASKDRTRPKDQVQMPKAIGEFLAAFDKGRHPELLSQKAA